MIFKLANGQVWQQRRHRYRYRYMFRPSARIYHDGGVHMMAVDGMDDPVEVVRVTVAEEGPIVSEFSEFSGDAHFRFQSGAVWIPASTSTHTTTSIDRTPSLSMVSVGLS